MRARCALSGGTRRTEWVLLPFVTVRRNQVARIMLFSQRYACTMRFEWWHTGLAAVCDREEKSSGPYHVVQPKVHSDY